MEPVTIFNIAASAVQLADVGISVLKNAHQLYKHGSLASQKQDEDVTKRLSDSYEKLKDELSQKPVAASSDDENVLQAATKCAEIAQELLKELEKSSSNTRGNLYRATIAGLRTLRKGKFDALQKELERYHSVLHTSILVRSETRALKAKRKEEVDRMKKCFWFDGMFDRQAAVSDVYHGTYRWIFNSELKPDDQEYQPLYLDSPSRPGDSFVQWLRSDQKIYWISGKPGSGKSCLMSYLVSHDQTMEKLAIRAGYDNTILLSHFFWRPGSDMQKSVRGLLQTLLYQLCQSQEDIMLQLISEPQNTQTSRNYACWSEKSLQEALKRYFELKHASTNLCIFVDGLDECLDDEQRDLITVLSELGNSFDVKLCLASRPERLFKLSLGQKRHLRLEDLNFDDMMKTTRGELLPVLKTYLSDTISPYQLNRFVRLVAEKAEGIFQWLDVVIKELIRAAQNLDDFDTLHSRLDDLPPSLEKLYTHLLGRLHRREREEGSSYFRMLLLRHTWWSRYEKLTILRLAFMHTCSKPWKSVTNGDVNYFLSEEFDKFCARIDGRIQICCAGLVDVATFANGFPNRRDRYYESRIQERIFRHHKIVSFLHRSVVSFLEDEYQGQLSLPADCENEHVTIFRMEIAMMHLISAMYQTTDRDKEIARHEIGYIGRGLFTSLAKLQANHDDSREYQAYWETMEFLPLIGNSGKRYFQKYVKVDCSWNEIWLCCASYRPFPLQEYGANDLDMLTASKAVLALFGVHAAIESFIDVEKPHQSVLDYLLACSVEHFKDSSFLSGFRRASDNISTIRLLIDAGSNPQVKLADDVEDYTVVNSAWSTFMLSASHYPSLAEISQQDLLSWLEMYSEVMKMFVARGADVNDRIVQLICTHTNDAKHGRTFFVAERTPLSYIYMISQHLEKWSDKDKSVRLKIVKDMETFLKANGAIADERVPWVKIVSTTFRRLTEWEHVPTECIFTFPVPAFPDIAIPTKIGRMFRMPRTESSGLGRKYSEFILKNTSGYISHHREDSAQGRTLQETLLRTVESLDESNEVEWPKHAVVAAYGTVYERSFHTSYERQCVARDKRLEKYFSIEYPDSLSDSGLVEDSDFEEDCDSIETDFEENATHNAGSTVRLASRLNV